jgi:hypothetical protein
MNTHMRGKLVYIKLGGQYSQMRVGWYSPKPNSPNLIFMCTLRHAPNVTYPSNASHPKSNQVVEYWQHYWCNIQHPS